mgnify:CR=1 FL=1
MFRPDGVPVRARLTVSFSEYRNVEIEAKKAAGYYTPEGAPDADALNQVKGRDLERF